MMDHARVFVSAVLRVESADKSNAGPGGQGGTISSGEAVEPSSKRPKLKVSLCLLYLRRESVVYVCMSVHQG